MENRRFIPTDVGGVVNRFLTRNFPQYVDYEFTARMEDELDAVSRRRRGVGAAAREFWKDVQQARRAHRDNVTREQRRKRACSAPIRRAAGRSACAWAGTARSCRSARRRTWRSRSSRACVPARRWTRSRSRRRSTVQAAARARCNAGRPASPSRTSAASARTSATARRSSSRSRATIRTRSRSSARSSSSAQRRCSTRIA